MTITKSINDKVQTIIKELNSVHKERREHVAGLWTAIIAMQHILYLGKPGSGKSFMIRDALKRIIPVSYTEVALFEGSDPSELVGPVDVKALAEDGRYKRITNGKLPDVRSAFIDEIFNANTPSLHAIMPLLNERIYHNDGQAIQTDLWTVAMATNKLLTEADVHAVWDRVHIRMWVEFLKDRDNQEQVILDAVKRKAEGRSDKRSTITWDEIEQAHHEAMQLDVPRPVMDAFFSIREAIREAGVTPVSDRRAVEAMASVLSTAWVRGHDRAMLGDLEVLRHMWWHRLEERDAVDLIVVEATNPSEKEATKMFEDIDTLEGDLTNATNLNDSAKKQRAGLEIMKTAKKLLQEASKLKDDALAAGTSTTRIDEVIDRTNRLMERVAEDLYHITPGKS